MLNNIPFKTTDKKNLPILMNPIKVLLVVLLVTACTSTFMAKPSLSLVDIEPTGISLFETTFRTSLRITNESGKPLTIHGGTHRLYINEIYIGKGTSNKILRLDANSSDVQEVEIHVSNLKVMSKIYSLIESKNFHYKLNSNLNLGGLFNLDSVTVTEENDFEL